MTSETQAIGQTALAVADRRGVALRTAIEVWAASSTGGTTRRREELIAKKRKVVEGFFAKVGRDPGEVTPLDVQGWCDSMRREDDRRPAAATLYARVSFLSSFYAWAQRELGLRANPALLARPKAPKPYQTESTKSWTDEELRRITSVIAGRAAGGDLVGKRDLALLLMYTSTGLRREEVIGLRGRDIQVAEDGLIIGGRVKGGRYRAREVRDPETKAALLDYLTAAGRLHVLKSDAPVWTRHDHPKLAGEPLTSHAFARNLKLYAREAGLDHAHLHQTRHTFGRIVAEETGSMTATQDALDHANLSTTTVYVQRIAVKRDLHSAAVARRRKGANAE
ncbi:MAG TPA: tyrosine-type recombinase/integrase [Pyrinomonadaceae bacterium]|nr:tyrosine-type recombinase/integrase [Pyrinomonadaceae bacterium]